MPRKEAPNVFQALIDGFTEALLRDFPVIEHRASYHAHGGSLLLLARHQTVFVGVHLLIMDNGVTVYSLGVADRYQFSLARYREDCRNDCRNTLLGFVGLEDPGLMELVWTAVQKGLNP